MSRSAWTVAVLSLAWAAPVVSGAPGGVRNAADAGATADVYYEQTTVVSKNGRTQGGGGSARVWFSPRRMRIEAGDPLRSQPLILRLDEGRALRLDPVAKLAVELDVQALRARSQVELATAGELLGGAEEARVRTTVLPGRRAIAGHVCRGYRIKSPTATLDLYVAEDLPLAVSTFADYLEWTGASQGLGGVLEEIRKLPGLPLETRSRVSVLGELYETLSTVTKVRVGPHPSALFEVPPGFSLVREADGEAPEEP